MTLRPSHGNVGVVAEEDLVVEDPQGLLPAVIRKPKPGEVLALGRGLDRGKQTEET